MQQQGVHGGGQRLGQQTVQVNLSRAFLSRHERPPTAPNTSLVVGGGGILGSLLHAAPVSCLVAASGLLRAGILANFGAGGVLEFIFGGASGTGNGVSSGGLVGLLSAMGSILPPPFSLLSYSPTSAHSPAAVSGLAGAAGRRVGGYGGYYAHRPAADTTADTVTVVCVTLLMWWLGRPAERRWGPGRFLTYLLVGYAASLGAYLVASATGAASPLSAGASLWMAPAVALLLNSLLLRQGGPLAPAGAAGSVGGASSSSAVFSLSALLTNLFSFRGFAGASLLLYALLLNVTGGALGGASSPAHASSSLFSQRAGQPHQPSPNSSVSVTAAAVALAPFVIAGFLQFFFATPTEAFIAAAASEGASSAVASKDGAPLPPQRAGSPTATGGAAAPSPVTRLRAAVQRILYVVACPHFVQPVLFRLLYAPAPSSPSAASAAAILPTSTAAAAGTPTAPPAVATAGGRSFQRRVIGRLEEIGYTRAGTLMTDEEEVFFAAQLQGMVPSPPRQQQQQQRGPNAAAAAAPQSPTGVAGGGGGDQLSAEQQEKVDTLLAIGLPNADARSVRHALASVGWDMDAAMGLLMEQ